jgi:hypothetical protein
LNPHYPKLLNASSFWTLRVSAHLFGLYAGLGLLSISRELAFGAFQRPTSKYGANLRWKEFANQLSAAPEEIATTDDLPEQIELHAGDDTVAVELSAPLRRLTFELSRVDDQSSAFSIALRWWRQELCFAVPTAFRRVRR